jgi:hypothetical protein
MKYKIALPFAAGLALTLSFGAAAGKGDIFSSESVLKNTYGISGKDTIRKFDKLCSYPEKPELVLARFQPNQLDYNTKLTPNGDITRGEHARNVLHLQYGEVAGFIGMAKTKAAKIERIQLQRAEHEKALKALRAHKKGEPLPSCHEPFSPPA